MCGWAVRLIGYLEFEIAIVKRDERKNDAAPRGVIVSEFDLSLIGARDGFWNDFGRGSG